MTYRSGFIAIIGRPNVGKSTLLNVLLGQKVAAVSPRPQTTRNRIQGIVNREDAQIVLIDTPGIHKPENALNRQMMDEVKQATEGIDIISLIVDAATEFGGGDRFAVKWASHFHLPVFLLLNKVDRIRKPDLLPLIDRYRKLYDFAEIFPISGLTGEGCADLVNAWIKYLPEAPPYFSHDQFTDVPERFLAAETIREKAILATREEVPHAIAVLVESFHLVNDVTRIRATIYVEREGQKGILIGKGGETMKKIGSAARKEIEELVGGRVFLELVVQVRPNWRSNRALVRQMDWRSQLEHIAASQVEEQDQEEQEQEQEEQEAG
jgi:GTPase